MGEVEGDVEIGWRPPASDIVAVNVPQRRQQPPCIRSVEHSGWQRPARQGAEPVPRDGVTVVECDDDFVTLGQPSGNGQARRDGGDDATDCVVMLLPNALSKPRPAARWLHTPPPLRHSPATIQMHSHLASERLTQLRLRAHFRLTQAPQRVEHGAHVNAELICNLEHSASVHEVHDDLPSVTAEPRRPPT